MPSVTMLRTRMIVALSILFAVVFGFFYLIFWLSGINLIIVPIVFAIMLIILQWALSSYLITKLSKVTWITTRSENPFLWDMVHKHAEEAGVKIERIGVSQMLVPNAFVYGIFGAKLVVTEGLLQTLADDQEALEGVIWHELGHVKHGDMKLMMVLSTLPMIFYMVAFSLMWGRSRGSYAVLVGALAFGLYFLMNLGILLISRYREYLADAYSSEKNGPYGIIRGLAKITYLNKKAIGSNAYSSSQITLKSLYIAEPEKGDVEYLKFAASLVTGDAEAKEIILQKMKEERKKGGLELFLTHPLTVNRIIALLEQI